MTETSPVTRTSRPAALHAYFGYRDAPAALSWLERVLGFEIVTWTKPVWPSSSTGAGR